MRRRNHNNEVGLSLTSQGERQTPQTAEKPYYIDNPRYVHISLAAEPDAITAYLRKHGNSDGVSELLREYPSVTFHPHNTTSAARVQSTESPISKTA